MRLSELLRQPDYERFALGVINDFGLPIKKFSFRKKGACALRQFGVYYPIKSVFYSTVVNHHATLIFLSRDFVVSDMGEFVPGIQLFCPARPQNLFSDSVIDVTSPDIMDISIRRGFPLTYAGVFASLFASLFAPIHYVAPHINIGLKIESLISSDERLLVRFYHGNSVLTAFEGNAILMTPKQWQRWWKSVLGHVAYESL